jgi:hypothetical protein
LKLSLISFLCSFSGLCIIAQVSSFISENKISLIRYSLIKFIQGVLSFFITFLISIFSITSLETSSITFNSQITNSNPYACIIPVISILTITILLLIINKLFFHTS